MRVALYYANDDVRIEERPEPTIGRGELLFRMMASGICGSDVMEWYRKPRAPLVLGHEVAGVVEEVGEGVTEFSIGDRIVTTHHVPCNNCRYCMTDRHSACKTLHTTTFDPGGFSELIRLPAINVERGTFPIPDNLSFEQASFVEPLACVVRAQRIAGVRAGDTVAVLGSGMSGVLHLQYARALGATRIFATDVHPFRIEAARSFGADEAFRADADLVSQVRAANEGNLVERVLVCTAAKPAMLQAIDLVDDGGTVLFFAPAAPGETMAFDMLDIWKRGITIVHSYAGPPPDMRIAVDLLARGKVEVTDMITHRLGLEDAAEGFRLTAEAGESLKVVLFPDR